MMNAGGSRWRAAARDLWLRLRPGRVRTLGTGPGAGLRLDPGAGNPDLATGAYEPPVQAALAARLRPGGVFIDVGANVGFLSVLAGRLVGPTGRVVAFEPVPANARLARGNAGLNRLANIEVIEAAVADRAGRATLVLARHAGGAALAGAARPPDECGELEVPVVTLDGWLAGNAARLPGPVSLLKVDVEGAELAVLRGGIELLRGGRPAVLLEVDAAGADEAESRYAACRDFLARLGYVVERLPDAYPGLAWKVIHLLAVPGS